MQTRSMPSFGLLAEKEKDRTYLLGTEAFIFTSPYVLTPSTARNAVAILLAVDSPPFLLGQRESMAKVSGALVGSLVPRSLAAVDVKLISINVCPTDPSFHILVKAAQEKIIHLPRKLLARYDTELEHLYAGKLASSEIRALYTGITTSIATYAGGSFRPNPHRSKIVEIVRSFPEISLGKLAAEIGVSYATASRLFCEAMGTPLRSYNHANRLQACWLGIEKAKPLTQVAHDAGFADSAHFTNAWRRAYGMTPSYVAKRQSCEVVSI